jgi:molybdopterin synthase sulfur carrier subunit
MLTGERGKTGLKRNSPPLPPIGGRGAKLSIMEIKVLFFGVLAEVTKTGFKHYRGISSFNDLKYRIQDEFPEIVHYSYVIALNNELINEYPVLNNNDEIALMPPFAGG